MTRTILVWLAVLLVAALAVGRALARDDATPHEHVVAPGDTWAALGARTGADAEALRAAYGHINRQRQPTIGATLALPAPPTQRGSLTRPFTGGLLETAVRANASPWGIALSNSLPHPYQPILTQPLLLPGGGVPRELPAGFTALALSSVPARPGEALGVRGLVAMDEVGRDTAIDVRLNTAGWPAFTHDEHIVALGGTGAFFRDAAPELLIQTAGAGAWVQPWLFEVRQFGSQQLTLRGTAAAITAEQIAQERERLFELWAEVTAVPLWTDSFILPLDSFVEQTADYGVFRSYNGGPYRSYHEGVDYAAFGGTPVLAPAGGRVVLAEELAVRGGAIIIDHGLGIFTGFYHLAEVTARPGQRVASGDEIGAVGSTGLSTGNHLHWDLLVNATWVDAAAWLENDMACWLLAGWGAENGPCAAVSGQLTIED